MFSHIESHKCYLTVTEEHCTFQSEQRELIESLLNRIIVCETLDVKKVCDLSQSWLEKRGWRGVSKIS